MVKNILAMVVMLVVQFEGQERSVIRPMAIAHVTAECKRIGLSKTEAEIAVGVDFALDVAIAEQDHVIAAVAAAANK